MSLWKRLWKLGLDYGEWPTMGQALHNLNEIESGIVYEGRMFEDESQKQVRRAAAFLPGSSLAARDAVK